jgi:hypothetical protein
VAKSLGFTDTNLLFRAPGHSALHEISFLAASAVSPELALRLLYSIPSSKDAGDVNR